MPPAVSRQHFKQARYLLGIVGKKTAYAGLLGAVFSYTDASVETYLGKHDMTSGAVAGLVTGTLFGLGRAMPQPVAWPLAFATTAIAADFIGELLPKYMKDFRSARRPPVLLPARVCLRMHATGVACDSEAAHAFDQQPG